MKENFRCCLLMAAYFSLNCVALCYAFLFLNERGLSVDGIGILVAVSCLASAVLQGVAGRLADSRHLFSWKNQLIFESVIVAALMALLLIFPAKPASALLYSLVIVFTLIMMPMVNSACFSYTESGAKVNFGLVRGIGSLFFALASLVTGKMVASMGYLIVPKIGILIGLLMMGAALLMPRTEPVSQNTDSPAPHKSAIREFFEFGSMYPAFAIMAAAIAMTLILQGMVNTFFIDIIRPIGGDAGAMGIAIAIAAASEIPVMFLYSKIEGRFGLGSDKLIAISCGFYVLRGILYMMVAGMTGIYSIQLLQGLSYGLQAPAKANYAYQTVDRRCLSTGQAVMSGTDVIGTVIGSMLGGFLLGRFGLGTMLLTGTILAAVGTVLAVSQSFGFRIGKRRAYLTSWKDKETC